MCVHNSFEDVKLCLTSVLNTLSADDRMIIVDDGSDTETKDLCEAVKAGNEDCVILIRHEKGNGFCKAANVGMRRSNHETIILLNSDTIVVGDWIDRLHACLNVNVRVGIAGPLSNAGGWQSIPYLPGPNAAPNIVKSDFDTLGEINAFCADFASQFNYPVVDQVNGFCLALKKSVLDTVGYFDEIRFPQGYGEENDLNLRAQEAGFLCAVAVDCFVYHAKTKSYSSEQRLRLSANGQAQLHELYGPQRIKDAVHGTQRNPVLVEVRKMAMDMFETKAWTVTP